jgi:hypothetical protein
MVVLLDQPFGVVADDEGTDGVAHLVMVWKMRPCTTALQLADRIGRDEDGPRSWLEKRMDYYLANVALDQSGGVRARIARRFALVYAADRLASEFGILPWTWKEALKPSRTATAGLCCHRMWSLRTPRSGALRSCAATSSATNSASSTRDKQGISQ